MFLKSVKSVSIIFKKYSCVIIQPEICQNPMGHRPFYAVLPRLGTESFCFSKVPCGLWDLFSQCLAKWVDLSVRSWHLLASYFPKPYWIPPNPYYTPIISLWNDQPNEKIYIYIYMKILVLYVISSFWAADWWYLVFNMLEGCDYTDCTSLLVIFCQHICDQKRLIATQTKLIRQLFQILPTHTGQSMSSSQLSHIVPPTDQSANGNSHSYRQLPHLLLAFGRLKTPT